LKSFQRNELPRCKHTRYQISKKKNDASLGEAYYINHVKKNALKSYTKALELDPNSESAKAMIQKLENIK
jgi:predicted negative regulator of RcsB-dependent stress response